MSFEWNEQKHKINLAKHGVSFDLAKLIFDGITLENIDDRQEYGEKRIGAYGIAKGELLFVVYTWRGQKRRIISARKAGTDEQKTYYKRISQHKEANN